MFGMVFTMSSRNMEMLCAFMSMDRDPVDMLLFTLEDLKMLKEELKRVVAKCSLELKWTCNTGEMIGMRLVITLHDIVHMSVL